MYFDRRLWELTRGLRGWIAFAILLGLVASVVGIARFVILGVLLSHVFSGRGFLAIALPAVGVAAAVILRGAIEHRRAMVSHRTATRVQAELRGRLYDKIAELGPAWFAGERTGGVMLSIVDGVEQLQTFFGQYVPQLSIAVLTPVAIFIFIAFWDVPVAAVMLVAALVTLIAPTVFIHIERRSSQGRQQALKAFGSEFLDGVQGLPTLKAFGQSRAFGLRLAERARELCDSSLRVLSTGVMTRGITDCGVAIGAAAALAVAAWRVSHGLMSIQALLIVLMAGTEVFRPLRDLRMVLHQGMLGQSAAAGINALFAAEPLVPPQPAGTAQSNVPLVPTIAFEDVGFSYPGGRGAAHDGLSFNVGAGEKIGIVGPSGSGKSSVARLLLRLFDPQRGRVLIGGRDLKMLDPEAVRRMIAVVHQDTYLFHGTVEENLRLGKPGADDEEIAAAARDANAHEFISLLPQGYRTMIGERGVMLSGGQRQRLAIARALLRDAPILILDEALSSVDAENEAVIQQAIDRLAAGRTTLVLAHRLSSVIGADRILVLDKGRVVEEGSHVELIRRDGPYRQLMGAQAEERAGDITLDADADEPDAAGEREQIDLAAETAPAELANAAAAVGWPATLGTLLRIIAPWRRRFAVVISSGIARVAAFIGVGILSALTVAAVKTGAPYGYLLILLALAAPLAGLLHWLESWLAHDIAYRLLAEMRIALFDKLDRLAPAYLLRRRSGDLIALASQDVETVEYFFAHTVAPALVAVLVPSAVLTVLAVVAWPIALALLPFVLFAALAPVVTRAQYRPAGGAGPRCAGAARRLRHRDDPRPRRPRRVSGGRGPPPDLYGAGARLPKHPAGAAGGSIGANGAARNRDRARRARGRGGRRAARRRAPSAADNLAIADPDLAVVVFADIGDRQCQPAACRYDRLDPPALCRAPRSAGGCRRPAMPGRAQRRLGDPFRRRELHLSRRPAVGAQQSQPRHPGRRHPGVGRPLGRRQDDDRQPAVALLGPDRGTHPDRRRRSARFRTRPPAPPHLAGVTGHLPVQRHVARQRGARPARGRRGGDPRGTRPGGAR